MYVSFEISTGKHDLQAKVKSSMNDNREVEKFILRIGTKKNLVLEFVILIVMLRKCS